MIMNGKFRKRCRNSGRVGLDEMVEKMVCFCLAVMPSVERFMSITMPFMKRMLPELSLTGTPSASNRAAALSGGFSGAE